MPPRPARRIFEQRLKSSPTSNLLRNSRLFSLPNPLPTPPVAEASGADALRASNTATLPYPTHQAIVTTPSSLARGDWGLKRPLPSRSRLVQTSKPVLKVHQLDTIEQITDFDSAADHVRTREKWAEMHAPMVRYKSNTSAVDSSIRPKSAFDTSSDVTAYDDPATLDEAGQRLVALKENIEENAREVALKQTIEGIARQELMRVESSKEIREGIINEGLEQPKWIPSSAKVQVDKEYNRTSRWRHEGPWLPGMGADAFMDFLTNQLAGRKKDFNEYLVAYVKNEIYTGRRALFEERRKKDPEILPLDPDEANEIMKTNEAEWSIFTPEEITARIKQLRAECAESPITSTLVKNLIIPFLRLPPMVTNYSDFRSHGDVQGLKFTDNCIPSSTHPSAGLGYLRTKSYLGNHPILGPQEHPAPIAARVLQPRVHGLARDRTAKLGIGGFVVDDEHSSIDTSMSNPQQAGRDVQTIDIDTPGGKKIQVEPRYASITPDGRVHVSVHRRSGGEVSVAKGWLEDLPPVRENEVVEPLDLSAFGKSGVKELDDATAAAANGDPKVEDQLRQFMSVMPEALKSEAVKAPEVKELP
ncbi:mitochondrial ribosomal protein subunit-domain-containing protein [Lophiotrema nucula]|uniref:Mitochondrial ribosomal protein subunit-domain-containing protein n=1 Tax=Lophiotrema nucula TaxID=690887 RepID=A0A6A5Z4A1_9PLEO|nr:mitochondrial ribosomal protein subunit-domain-containing protein [Lophiotrema nucula]